MEPRTLLRRARFAATTTLALVLASAISLAAEPARADVRTDATLLGARRALGRYDTAGGTAEVIRDLTALLPEARGGDGREARFLRAVAATDLLMLSYGPGGSAEQRDALAEALSVEPNAVAAHLDAELAALELGAYEETARDARWTLRALAGGEPDAALLLRGQGLRRDVLFVRAVLDAIGRDDELTRLARYGLPQSPTGEMAAFSAEGRRAVAALREADEAMRRLEAIAAAHEPLTASLAGTVAVDGALLRTTEIRPAARFPDDAPVHAVGSRGQLSSPDLVLWVDETHLFYAFSRSARVTRDGMVFAAAGEPALPAYATLPLPADSRIGVVPFDDLTEQLAAVARAAPVQTMGLAASTSVESLRISRVLMSLSRTGLPTPQLLGRGTTRELRALPVELVMGTESETPFSVFVRMGGFTVNQGRRSDSLPRVRDANGLHFDLASLERTSRASSSPDASIRYMGVVSWGNVLDAAFRLHPRHTQTISLVLY